MTALYIPEQWKDEDDYDTKFFNGNYARGIDLTIHASDFSGMFHMKPEARTQLPELAKHLEGTQKHLMFHAYRVMAQREYDKGRSVISDYYNRESWRQLRDCA